MYWLVKLVSDHKEGNPPPPPHPLLSKTVEAPYFEKEKCPPPPAP
jgi:hypothetical protein